MLTPLEGFPRLGAFGCELTGQGHELSPNRLGEIYEIVQDESACGSGVGSCWYG